MFLTEAYQHAVTFVDQTSSTGLINTAMLLVLTGMSFITSRRAGAAKQLAAKSQTLTTDHIDTVIEQTNEDLTERIRKAVRAEVKLQMPRMIRKGLRDVLDARDNERR